MVGVEDVEAEDVLLSGAPVWPILERRPTALIVLDGASRLAPNEPGHDRAVQPIDELAEAMITAHMLSTLNDDSVTSGATSRQSA